MPPQTEIAVAGDRAVAEASAVASAIKRGYIRRFIVEGLVAATPPESTMDS
jgi:hypothetical protein